MFPAVIAGLVHRLSDLLDLDANRLGEGIEILRPLLASESSWSVAEGVVGTNDAGDLLDGGGLELVPLILPAGGLETSGGGADLERGQDLDGVGTDPLRLDSLEANDRLSVHAHPNNSRRTYSWASFSARASSKILSTPRWISSVSRAIRRDSAKAALILNSSAWT